MTQTTDPNPMGSLPNAFLSRPSDRLIPLADVRTTTFIEDRNPRQLAVAGVLVPIIPRPSGTTLLLTQRATTLTKHAGQISFPGGRSEVADLDIVATALREAWEETGIGADFISPIGGLEPVESVTGFLMVPIVGLVRDGFTATPNPGEVDDIFEVPLEFVLNASNHVQKFMIIDGAAREFYSIAYGSRDIWGATARILVNLSRLSHDLSLSSTPGRMQPR